MHQDIPAPKSIGHGKVVPPEHPRPCVLTYLMHMSEKVGTRLRRHHLEALTFSIGLRTADGWIGGKLHCALPTNDGRQIMALCRSVINETWHGQGVHQVQVTALDPVDSGISWNCLTPWMTPGTKLTLSWMPSTGVTENLPLPRHACSTAPACLT